jgi:hypothetical protein
MPCFENGSSARLGHGRSKHPIIKDILIPIIPNLDSLVKELKGKREKMKLNNITHQHDHPIQKILR